MIGYGSDAVVAATQANSPDFGGLVGLPLLRTMRYGGDADFFCPRVLIGRGPGRLTSLTPDPAGWFHCPVSASAVRALASDRARSGYRNCVGSDAASAPC